MLENGGAAAAAASVSAQPGNPKSNIEAALEIQRQGSTESLKNNRRDTLKEETVEALLAKLSKKGKNVKIVAEADELAAKEENAK